MAKKAFLVYEGDAWLMKDSLCLQGVYSTREKAIDAILRNHSITAREIRDAQGYPEDEMRCREDVNALLSSDLQRSNQTQCYSTNYKIEEVSLDNKEWD